VNVLGIETATAVCGAAVAADGRIVREVQIDRPYVHAESLFGIIDQVLSPPGPGRNRLDGVAVSIGPGSFTGLRIGLSAAKGLVFGMRIPLVAVSTLEALAHHAAEILQVSPNERILAAIDARRDEVYCQLFRWEDRRLVPEGDPRAEAVEALREELKDRNLLVTGDGASKVTGEDLPALSRWRRATGVASRCSAGSVALLGAQRLSAGSVDDPATLEPRYIKEFYSGTTIRG
jgi:tRNA threonylcarbamoyladenosine biosynthesis protein TsaB